MNLKFLSSIVSIFSLIASANAWVFNDFEIPWNGEKNIGGIDASISIDQRKVGQSSNGGDATLTRTDGMAHFTYSVYGVSYPGAGFSIYNPNIKEFSLSTNDTITLVFRGKTDSCAVGGAGICEVKMEVHSNYGDTTTTYEKMEWQGATICYHLKDYYPTPDGTYNLITSSMQTIKIPVTSLQLDHWKNTYTWVTNNRDSILAHVTGFQFWFSADGTITTTTGYLDIDEISVGPSKIVVNTRDVSHHSKNYGSEIKYLFKGNMLTNTGSQKIEILSVNGVRRSCLGLMQTCQLRTGSYILRDGYNCSKIIAH